MKTVFISFITLCFISVLTTSAQKLEPKWAGTAIAVDFSNDSTSIPLEKANVKVKTSHSAGKIIFGIGNSRRKCVIQGGQSSTQLTPNSHVTLIVKCKDNESDPSSFIQIIKFDENKKERKTELANINWLENVSEGNMNLIPYEAESYGQSSYILTFPSQEGEFGIRILNPNDQDEKVPVFQCFGIHY